MVSLYLPRALSAAGPLRRVDPEGLLRAHRRDRGWLRESLADPVLPSGDERDREGERNRMRLRFGPEKPK